MAKSNIGKGKRKCAYISTPPHTDFVYFKHPCPILRLLLTPLFIVVPVESEDQQKLRFQVELEFIQCLANPNYLHCESPIVKYPIHPSRP